MTPNAEQVKTLVLYLLASSGPIYQLLLGKGVTPDQIGSLQNLAITFGPSIVAVAIAVARRTQASVVAAAARLLADRGKITVAPGVSAGTTSLATNASVPNVTIGSVRSHWAPLFLGLSLIGSLCLGGCVTSQDGVEVTVTPSNFLSIVQAKVQASCPSIQALANATQILAPVVADLAGKPDVGKTASEVAGVSTAACNMVTGQLATGTTAVPPVVAPAVPAPAVPAPGSS